MRKTPIYFRRKIVETCRKLSKIIEKLSKNYRKIIENCDHNVETDSARLFVSRAGLPDFSWYKIPKREKIYQITTNYTKFP
jgi:hypothetical protein